LKVDLMVPHVEGALATLSIATVPRVQILAATVTMLPATSATIAASPAIAGLLGHCGE
jgi:hypothetical protein